MAPEKTEAESGEWCRGLVDLAMQGNSPTSALGLLQDTRYMGPCVIVQSTPSPWTLWDGVLRSEVVGWEKGLEEWLFHGMNESVARPMERVLFERSRDIGLSYETYGDADGATRIRVAHPFDGAGGGNRADDDRNTHSSVSAVVSLGPLGISETLNAENDVITAL